MLIIRFSLLKTANSWLKLQKVVVKCCLIFIESTVFPVHVVPTKKAFQLRGLIWRPTLASCVLILQGRWRNLNGEDVSPHIPALHAPSLAVCPPGNHWGQSMCVLEEACEHREREILLNKSKKSKNLFTGILHKNAGKHTETVKSVDILLNFTIGSEKGDDTKGKSNNKENCSHIRDTEAIPRG